jgi:peptide subunit release factor 1 (eRF1)
MLRGRKATVHFASSQNRVELKPESIFADEIDSQDFVDPQPTERIERLEKSFFDCIRGRHEPVANVELAIRTQTVLCLAEMSERLGLTLFFDEKSREIKTGDGGIVAPLSYETVVPKLPS